MRAVLILLHALLLLMSGAPSALGQGAKLDAEDNQARLVQLTRCIEHDLVRIELLALEIRAGRELVYEQLNASVAKLERDVQELLTLTRAITPEIWASKQATLTTIEAGVGSLADAVYDFSSENSLLRHEIRLMNHRWTTDEATPREWLLAGALLASQFTLFDPRIGEDLDAALQAIDALDTPLSAERAAALRALNAQANEVNRQLNAITTLTDQLPIVDLSTAISEHFMATARKSRTARDLFFIAAVLLGGLAAYGLRRQIRTSHRAQQAEQASAARADFLANMSHEVRTPMNGIVTVSELMMETPLDAQQKEYAHILNSSASALMRILNDILDFSKVDAGKTELEVQPFAPLELVLDVSNVVSSTAASKGLELVLDCQGVLPRSVHGDAGRLRQVLLNLLGNAIKFTQRGHVVLQVCSKEIAAGTFELVFAVNDSGVGIEQRYVEQIFEPFRQADTSTTRRFGGTGLGLSICRQLAELMNGRLTVNSAPGRGSSFVLTLTMKGERGAAAPTRKLPAPTFVALQPGPTRALVLRLLGHQARPLTATAVNTQSATIVCELARLETIAAKLQQAGLPQPARWLTIVPRGLPVRLPNSQLPLATLRCPFRASDLWNALETPQPHRNTQATPHPTAAQTSRPPTPSAAPMPTPPERASIAAVPANSQAPHILLVEDNRVNQKVAEIVFRRLGHVIEVVDDGALGVEAVRAKMPDIIFMDCQMPVMDGYQATAAIRALGGQGARVPIVALTANAMKGDRARCLKAGMTDYMTKPIDLELLKSILQKHLKPGGADKEAAA